MSENIISIERSNCGDCYRCVRECEVKAIKCVHSQISIDTNRCVTCGQCYFSCPGAYIKLRDDLDKAKNLIINSEIIVASLSPMWVAEFSNVEQERMIEALKLLGFTHVSQSALGAEYTRNASLEVIQSRQGIHVASHCPSVVDYIQKHRPEYIDKLIPIEYPMVAHAKMIKNWMGEKAKVIHISPCISAKRVADINSDLIDLSITFRELKQWMIDQNVDFSLIPGNDSYKFEPFSARQAATYQVSNGYIHEKFLARHNVKHIEIFTQTGLENINEVLNNLDPERKDKIIYLDFLACPNGCVKGPGIVDESSSYVDKTLKIKQLASKSKHNEYNLPLTYVKRDMIATPVTKVSASDLEIAMNTLGIQSWKYYLNCNSCGFGTCEEFASALSRGDATEELCIPHTKRVANKIFSSLVENLHSGVLILDKDKNIINSNKSFAYMMGSNVYMKYELNKGLNNEDLSKIVPFYDLFEEMDSSQQDSMEKEVMVKGQILKVSLFKTITEITICLVRNLFVSDVRNEELVVRTKQAIKDNLDTVQKIAYLLGETASRTEAILNSILESHNANSSDK